MRLLSNPRSPTSPADVLDLMEKTWELTLPSALISILDSRHMGRKEAVVKKTSRLALQRGIAEALQRTHAWVCTAGHTDGLGTRTAGLAIRYARRELNESPVCVGVVNIDDVRQASNIREKPNGDIVKYDGTGAGKVRDANHTHFLLVDGHG